MFMEDTMATLNASYEQASAMDCIQTEPIGSVTGDRVFAELMLITAHDPCAACPVDKKQCNCYKLYHSTAQLKSKGDQLTKDANKDRQQMEQERGMGCYAGETVKSVALATGLSKNQVRKAKQRNLFRVGVTVEDIKKEL
jgi:hypothetical protein